MPSPSICSFVSFTPAVFLVDLSAESFIANDSQVSERVAAFASLLFVNSPETYKFIAKVLPLPKVIIKYVEF